MVDKGHIRIIFILTSAVIITFPVIASATVSSSYWIDQGWDLLDQNKFQEALQAFDRALSLDPTNAEGWNGKGWVLLELYKHNEAFQAFNKSVSLDPTDKGAWLGKAHSLANLGRTAEAIEAYDRALALDPSDLGLLTNKADCLSRLGNTKEANEIYTQVVVLAVKPSDLPQKARALFSLDRYEEALQAFNQALSENPDEEWMWGEKGFTLHALERYEEALEAYDKALSLNPNLGYIWSSKGYSLQKLGRYEEAIQAYDQALLLDPSDTYALNEKNNVNAILRTPTVSVQTTSVIYRSPPIQTDPLFSFPSVIHLIVIAGEIVIVFLLAGVLSLNIVRANEMGSQLKALLLILVIGGAGLMGYISIPYLATIPNRPLESLIFSEVFPIFLIVGGLILYRLIKNNSLSFQYNLNIQKAEEGGLLTTASAAGTDDDHGEQVPTHTTVTVQGEKGTGRGEVSNIVFISYSQQDKLIADAVTVRLESQGIRCWIAPRDVLPGKNYPEAIINAIDHSRIMVLIFSSSSNNSPHVIRELTRAVDKELIIIPFRIEDIQPSLSMEYLINVPHWLDAITPPLEKHIATLVDTIQSFIK